MRKFEDIIAWQESRSLTNLIYGLFKDSKDFSFKDQIQRASVSIMNNIAEGFERDTDQEFIHFLYIAKGSCGEVRSMAYLGKDLSYIDEVDYKRIVNLSTKISALIYGFIKKLEKINVAG